MDDDDLRDEIVELEARIEDLTRAIESCAKIIQISRVAIALGAILLAATVFGAIGFEPLVMISAIAALIGGVVSLGSNQSTSHQASEALKAAEARRAALIGAIDLRVVGD